MEFLVAAQLVAAAGLLEIALRLVRFPRLIAWVRASARDWGAWFPLGKRALKLGRVRSLAAAATRVWRGHDDCLPRSFLTLWLLLAEDHSREARLVIGVRKVTGEPFRAHAWVETDSISPETRPEPTGPFTVLTRY
jgi:hypothetical protein